MRPLALLVSISLAACAAEHDHLSDEEVSDLFEDAYEEQEGGKADGADCSGVRVPDRAPFDKVVALTFDDGPNVATTPAVLETLRRHGVPATFFINGRRVDSEAAEAIAADIAADPSFVLANHTWSHPQMTRLSAGEVADQIDDTTAVIEAAGGTPRYFRFPFGASNCSTASAVRARGYAVTGWHVDSADWCFSTGTPGVCPRSQFQYVDDDLRSDMVGYTMRQVRARGGGIVLFHDIHAYTAEQLDVVITQLKAEGYSFTNLTDASVFPLLNEVAPEPAPGGDQARVATDLNLRSGPGTDHPVLVTMPAGALVEVLDDSALWWHVDYQGIRGWAHSGYLER